MAKKATLVRGSTYYLGTKLFTKDKAVEITDAEYALLTDDTEGEAYGYDRIEVEGREELRSKFKFTDGDEPAADEAEAAPATRTRVRRPAAE